MAKLHYKGECCTDCLFFIANGDLPHENTKEQDEKFIARIQKNWPGRKYHLSVGDRTNEFSVSECDSCGSRLAGERHEFVVLTS